jgi:hypothetical protein
VGHMGNFSASLTRTPFHVILLWGDQSKSLWANESFLDATLASELNISTQPLSIPVEVRALDALKVGSPITPLPSTYVCQASQRDDSVPANQVPSDSCGVGILLAPAIQPTHQLVYGCYHGLESVLPRPLSEVGATVPGTSAWVLRGGSRYPGGVQHVLGHIFSATPTL